MVDGFQLRKIGLDAEEAAIIIAELTGPETDLEEWVADQEDTAMAA